MLVYCGDVVKYCGPLKWDSCDLNVRAETDHVSGEVSYYITDEGAGFLVVCSVVETKKMQERYPD